MSQEAEARRLAGQLEMRETTTELFRAVREGFRDGVIPIVAIDELEARFAKFERQLDVMQDAIDRRALQATQEEKP